MALAEWGRWDDELDAVTLATLQVAYVRRQQMVARMRAVAVVNALGEGLGAGGQGSGGAGGQGVSARGRRYREVGAEAFMREAGIRW